MKTASQNNTAIIILSISVLAILFILGYLYRSWLNMDFPDFYTDADKMSEYQSLLFHLPVLAPAILGIWISKKKNIKPVFLYGYIAYLVIAINAYYFAITATDPLAAGMFFIALLLPYSMLFAIFLLLFLLKK